MHKETENELPLFRSILSAIGTPTYKLAKVLLHENEYIATDSFHFAKEICKQDPYLYMASLDVETLFTNILLD